MKFTFRRAAVVTLTIVFAMTLGWANAARIDARLDSSEVALGEAAQLTVTIQGQDATTPQIPPVNGLTFQQVGQSSEVEIINGAMSANLSYVYAVAASRSGTFTIPPIRTGNGPDAARSAALVLKVGSGAGGTSASANGKNPNLPPPPVVGGDTGDAEAAAQNSFGFLRLVTPKKEFYVGEMVPVELKACFRAGVELRVDGLPQLNSDAFTMNKLGSQPITTREIINGAPYTVFTWPTAITAVKAGDYEMNVEIPVTVTVRQRPQQSRSGDPFGDDAFADLFDNFFGAATQKQIALDSGPNAVRILSLPAENRPAGFAGAVGRFDLAAEAGPTQIAAGDPVTLKLKIRGEGNFDRVTAPTLASGSEWKAYKPGAAFEPADSAGFSGSKNFEQALIPTKSGRREIPALAFSYFDPAQKQYVTRTTTPITIEVAPGPTPAALAVPARPAAAAALPAATPATDLAPNRLDPGHFTRTLRPWLLNPWLVAIALLPSAVLAGLYLFLRRRARLAADPEHARKVHTERVLSEQLRAMERAAEHGQTMEFFVAACAALQVLLGRRWNLSPRTITLAEINVRLNGEADGLRTIFSLADEVIYTGRAFAPAELRHWQALVNHELRKLEEL